MKKRISLLTIVTLLALTFLARAETNVVEAQENILPNGSFEEPYNNGVAGNWAPWHQDSNEKLDCNTETYFARPTWSGEQNGALIFDGGRSMHIGNQFDTWRAGVFQNVSVTPGQNYRFSAFLRGRGSNEQYPAPSDASVNMRGRVGIDPTGGGVWTSGSIIWSNAVNPHDRWDQAIVEATATGGQVTVFVEGNFGGPNNCRAHLDMWFDNAELIATGVAAEPTAAPAPVQQQPVQAAPVVQPTAVPTNTPIPTATPIPTETPIPSPTFTPTPAGGTICVNAFSDSNANGVKDGNEGYMAGVRFTVAQGSAVVAEGASPGTNNPVCFESLAVGNYQVAQVLPDTLEMTTAGNIEIPISQGQNIRLEFGSRVKQVEAQPVVVENTDPQPTAVSQVADTSAVTADTTAAVAASSGPFAAFGPWEIAALAIMGLAVILLITVVVLLLRQNQARS